MLRHWTSILIVCVIIVAMIGAVVGPGTSAAQDDAASPEPAATLTEQSPPVEETAPDDDLPPGEMTFDAATETTTAGPPPETAAAEPAPSDAPAEGPAPDDTATAAPDATSVPAATIEPDAQSAGAETPGALTIVATTPWGTALADVCVQAVPAAGGAPAAEGCSGADGRVSLADLAPGDYTVSAFSVPSGWQVFTPATVAIASGQAGELPLTVPFVSGGSLTVKAVVMSGPEVAPGGCVRVTTRDGGQPGSHVIAGPLCDDDRDGAVVIPEVPDMRICLVVDPPPGFFRPKRDYAHCVDSWSGNGLYTVGFRSVPATPTPTVDTPTPYPTSTPTPTRTPAPDEGNVSLTVRNCVAVFDSEAEPTDYNGCRTAPAGVRLRVMQGANEAGIYTTNANGAIAFALPALTAYRIDYLDGNDPDWVPSASEESRLRYGEGSTFFFVPAPEVDDSWTMVVRLWNNSNVPIPGGCAKIVDYQHPEVTLLPELCDTDGDGEIVLGELPARPQTSTYSRPTAYGAVVTSLPVESGYTPLPSPYGGVEPNDLDFRWVSTPTLSFISVSLRITFNDAVTGAPVQGLCLEFDAGGLDGGLVCDQGIGLIETSLPRNTSYVASVTNVPPGYLQPSALPVDTPRYPQGTPENPSVHLIERTVELARDPNGATDRADVVIFLRQVIARGDNPFVGGSPVAEPVCLTISPVPDGTLATRCTTTRYGTVFFIDLPPGEYTFTADWSPAGTGWSCGTDPSPFALTVGADDPGTLLARTFTWQCRYPAGQGVTCIVVDERVIRDVDVYLGTLRDPETGEVISTTVQFSEAVSERFAVALLDPEDWGRGDLNPAPDFLTWETVKAWIERGEEAWGLGGDWDGDARQRAIDHFEGVLGGPVVFEEEAEIAVSEIPGGIFSTTLFSPTQEESPLCYGPGKVVVLTTSGLARVRFVEVSAIPAPPSPTPTATPDGSSTPTPTAPPEEAVCVSPLVREVSLAYGALRDGDAVLDEGVAVSDPLPPELVAAILADDPPDAIADGLDDWADDGLDPFAWSAGTPSGSDPVVTLLDGFGNAVAAEPRHDGALEYVIASRIVSSDETELPEGCVVASWGLLYPVEERVIARVHVTRQDAIAPGGAAGTPTATPTPVAPHPTPTATAETDAVTALPRTGAGDEPRGHDRRGIWLAIAAVGALILLGQRGGRRARRA